MAATPKYLTDEAIIRHLQNREEQDKAIRYLYHAHFEMLTGWIVANGGSEADGADIFQEVMLSFVGIVQQRKFRGASSIKTFLFSMNRNLWYNELKRKGRATVREMNFGAQQEEETDHATVLEMREQSASLMKIMDDMGADCKKILLLYYYENKSMKEILATMNYENEQVVRNKKYKCMQKLESMINKDQNLYIQLKNFLNE